MASYYRAFAPILEVVKYMDHRATLIVTDLNSDQPPQTHPVVYDSIDAKLIKSSILSTSGAAGPSGLDAKDWKHMCTSFKSASNDLCHALSEVAKHLCVVYVDPTSLAPLVACRLIAVDKLPGGSSDWNWGVTSTHHCKGCLGCTEE